MNIAKRFLYRFIFVLAGCFHCCNSLLGTERITQYLIDIVLNQDSTVLVTETITVYSERNKIKRGIIREIPNRYLSFLGTNFYVPINVQSILLDGSPQQYTLSDTINGIQITIRDDQKILSVGFHTFVIQYLLHRQIAFFNDHSERLSLSMPGINFLNNSYESADPNLASLGEKHDEFEWNAIGTNWEFAIEKADVRIQLPAKVPQSSVRFVGWRGPYGSLQTSGLSIDLDTNGIVTASISHPLPMHHGVTLVIGWAPGYVDRPSYWSKISHFIIDNPFFIFMLAALVLLIFLSVTAIIIMKGANKPGIIIPLFYPPPDMSASVVRFITTERCDEKCLASEVVQWAIDGLITISCVPRTLRSPIYTLKKISDMKNEAPTVLQRVFECLFRNGPELTIDGNWKARDAVADAHFLMMRSYERQYTPLYFDDNGFWMVVIFFISCISTLFIGLGMNFSGNETWFGIFVGIEVLLNVVVSKYSQFYSKLGRAMLDKIQGFYLFLTTTHTERLKLIGTPPTKTPELYETYLPYAIALDAEEKWSYQFAPIFSQQVQAGKAYTPIWFSGTQWSLLYANALGTHIAQAVHKTVQQVATTTPSPSRSPGSGSGFGGGGSVGSGGGGGAGRGC